jgi:hypothetical protein
MKRMPSWSQKKSRREIFQRIFALGIFWGGVSRYAATPLIVALFLARIDITRFRPWSPIATAHHLDGAEKIPKFSRTTGTVDVFGPRLGISGPTWRRVSACPNPMLHLYMKIIWCTFSFFFLSLFRQTYLFYIL